MKTLSANLILLAMLAIIGTFLLVVAQRVFAERYDPTLDPNVQSYMVCIQVGSGGADNSAIPDPSLFDEQGYVEWTSGTGAGTAKAILCQDVDKS